MRKLNVLLIGLLGIFFAFATPVLAIPALKATFVIGQKSYTTFDGQVSYMDVAPFLENGRTYVPLRFICDAIGVPFTNVNWDNTKRTATLTISSTTVEFTVGSTSYTVNGQTKQMDVAPVLKDGRVFLPARYVAEVFGCSVSWDDKNKTVILTSTTNTVDDSKNCPPVINVDSPYDYLVKLNKVHPGDGSFVFGMTVTNVKADELTGTIQQALQDNEGSICKSITIKKQSDTILLFSNYDLSKYNLPLTDIFKKDDYVTVYCDRYNNALLLDLQNCLLGICGKVKVLEVGPKTLQAQLLRPHVYQYNQTLRSDLAEKIASVKYYPGVVLNLLFKDSVTVQRTESPQVITVSDLTSILRPGDEIDIIESFGELRSVKLE